MGNRLAMSDFGGSLRQRAVPYRLLPHLCCFLFWLLGNTAQEHSGESGRAFVIEGHDMFCLGEEQPALDKHASDMRQQRQH